MFFFNFSVIGIESLSADFAKEIKGIDKAIPQALKYVGSEMIESLKKHIYSDWYTQYDPKIYKRRTDDPSRGTPLGSEDYMDATVVGKSMIFTYEPSGVHSEEKWHERDGDDLITFLQLERGSIPSRPFWNNFVGEQRETGIMDSFAAGMKPYLVIAEGGERDVIFGAGESELEAGSQNLSINDDE